MLTAGAGSAVGVDAEIVVVDGRSRGRPRSPAVPRPARTPCGGGGRHRTETGAPAGASQPPPWRSHRRALPANLDGGVLDARLLTLGGIEDLRLQAAPLRPAHIHAREHLSPVLGVDPAFTGVHHEDGVRAVVRPGEGRVELELRRPRLSGALIPARARWRVPRLLSPAPP